VVKKTPKQKLSKKQKDLNNLFVNFEINGKKPNIFVILLFILAGWLIISSFFLTSADSKKVSLSEITNDIEQGKIEKLEFSTTEVKAYPIDGSTLLKSKIPANTDFLNYLSAKQLDTKVQTVTPIDDSKLMDNISLIINILFFGLFAFFIFSMFKQSRGGAGGPGDIFNFAKSKAKMFQKGTGKNTTFKDLAVSEEVREEMYELVDFLKHQAKYKKVGARIPKGVLLVGPAGVGKTLLARAIAGEANVPFYNAAGSEFMEMLVGVGSARVRDMFKNAKASPSALIFIDEIDAIGRQRGMGIGGGHDEREQTLNQILVEMDGFDQNTNVIVIAATNRPDMLDPALVRAGRFDRKISLTLPAVEEREKIIAIHLKGKPLTKGIKLDQIAKRTVGFSGADIENMLNEAAILAARKNKSIITFKDISEAATKVKLGPERKMLSSEEEKKMTAYHEAGHAIVAHYLDKADPVRRISIVARTQSLGHTDMSSDREEYNYSKQKLMQTISVMLGGRAAEEVFFKEQSVGASNDIERATDIAKRMVTEWGMSPLGPINYVQNEDRKWLAMQLGTHNEISENKKDQIDKEIEKIILAGKKVAEEIIKKHKKQMILVSEELIKVETLEQDDFEKLVGAKK